VLQAGLKVEQSRHRGPYSRPQVTETRMIFPIWVPDFDQQMRAVGIHERKRRRDHRLEFRAGFEIRPDMLP